MLHKSLLDGYSSAAVERPDVAVKNAATENVLVSHEDDGARNVVLKTDQLDKSEVTGCREHIPRGYADRLGEPWGSQLCAERRGKARYPSNPVSTRADASALNRPLRSRIGRYG